MAGGTSDPSAREAMTTIAQAIPNAQARTLEREHHVPADDVLTSSLAAFFV